ncbi:hypothetical protein GCM10009612_76910 [Streptomyces beijiangensis]
MSHHAHGIRVRGPRTAAPDRPDRPQAARGLLKPLCLTLAGLAVGIASLSSRGWTYLALLAAAVCIDKIAVRVCPHGG